MRMSFIFFVCKACQFSEKEYSFILCSFFVVLCWGFDMF
jgi:hypothetical protein